MICTSCGNAITEEANITLSTSVEGVTLRETHTSGYIELVWKATVGTYEFYSENCTADPWGGIFDETGTSL